MKKQVNKEHYSFSKYIDKDRFMSYYYQLKYIYDINPENILEIGTGTNFIKKIVKDDFDYETMDIDPELNPDIVGSVVDIPKESNSYDLITCFQVLEHLPFSKFKKGLKEISRVTKKYALISLPYSVFGFKFQIKISLMKIFYFSIRIPKFYKKHKFDGQHYWEIGKRRYSLSMIKTIIRKYFYIDEVLNPYENKYHIFFKLRKK